MQEKRISRGIRLGKLAIGGGAPVMVQSMTKTALCAAVAKRCAWPCPT